MTGETEKQPTVSVIIPTLNGAQWLMKLLAGLREQTLVPVEIVVVDSGSTDETCAIARAHDVHLLEINRRDFDHGGTRTMAARQATGDILVYMTQDAVPAARDVLALLVLPFAGDTTIAATYGRQLATEDAGFFAAHLRLVNYPDHSQVRCWKDRSQWGFKTIFISNSFAAYRRDVLAAHGYFPERVLFGEDTLTLAKLLESGYCVEYVADACVYHSHNSTIWQDFKRYFDIGVFHADQSEQLLKFGGPGGAGRKYVRSELAMLVTQKKYYLLPECLLRTLGKFVAYSLGKRYRIFPRCLAKRLSMNRSWWSQPPEC